MNEEMDVETGDADDDQCYSSIFMSADYEISSNSDNDENDDDLPADWQYVSEENDQIPPRLPFTIGDRKVGTQISANIVEPYDIFRLFFTDELIENIVLQTNAYANFKINTQSISKSSTWNNWKNTTCDEMKAFIGVILNMGLVVLDNVEEYWSQELSTRIPWFAKIFKRQRFLQIFWMFHLNEYVVQNSDLKSNVHKASNYIEYLDEKFRDCFIPEPEISVEEAGIDFKGKIQFITHNPNIKTKWEIRIYVLIDTKTGYICAVLPCYGKITSASLMKPELPVGARIVLHLYNKLLEKIPEATGYHIFTDKSFTSLKLADELLLINAHLTGIIHPHKKSLPITVAKPNFKENKTIAIRCNNNLLLAWREKQSVVTTLLSTWHTANMVIKKRTESNGTISKVPKPQIHEHYIKTMDRTARGDDYISNFCFNKKSVKWWKKLFFWGLQTVLANTYILYKENCARNNFNPLSQRKFQSIIVNKLVGDFKEGSKKEELAFDNEERLNGKLHILRTLNNKKTKECSVCSTTKRRRRTTYYCDTCERKPGLHLGDCFQIYHTKRQYKIQS